MGTRAPCRVALDLAEFNLYSSFQGRGFPAPFLVFGGVCMQYTFSLSRRSLPVRCLCLLLVVLVLWCFFCVPRAGAVALEAATVAYAGALVGTILVGAGVVFASHGDMQAVGAAMYKSWVSSSNAIGSKISALASWAVEHGEAAAKGALRIGKDLYQGIIDAFNAIYSNGKVSLGDGVTVLPSDATDEEISNFVGLFAGKDIKSFYFSEYTGQSNERVHHAYFTRSGSVFNMVITNPYGNGGTYERTIDVGSETVKKSYFMFSHEDVWMYLNFFVETRSRTRHVTYASAVSWGLSASLSPISVSVSSPDLVYPSDDYLVKMPDLPAVDEVTGAVSWPSDAAYTKDAVSAPYPTDADGVKVPDIPYDKVVDQSTGKTLGDTDTGTDTDKPDAGTDTGTDTGGLLGQIIALLKNFFDSPSDFKLNFDGFRNLILPERFPFCIPFDLINSVRIFAVTAASDFVFRIDLDTSYWSIHHAVDLAPFTLVITFFRYAAVAGWVWFLINRTRSLIKW